MLTQTRHTAADILGSLDVDLAALLDLEGLSEETPGAVFLSGSAAEGMSNPYSDIDVFIVGPAEPRGRSIHRAGDAVFSVHMLGSRRVDFEFWTDGAVQALAERLVTLSVADEGRGNIMLERRLTEDQMVFLHRLGTGVPLFHPERLDQLRARFDFKRLARYLLEVKMREVDDALEDLYGMMDQPDVGLMRTRDLLNSTCDAFCHFQGNTNIRRKWRTRLLELLAREPRAQSFRDRYWELQFPDVGLLRGDPVAYRAYVESCIRLCNQVTDWIQG